MILEDGKPKYTNRLLNERSPYLVQHAHNPVNWYPWGDAAFTKARKEDKPVFLSIGYSTCHWCHVMERESFDDEEVAEFLNQHFVSIKLDREERPDLDEIYMTGLQMMTGQGGWPMSNFITAEGKPFYAGTYYPKDNFLAVLRQLLQAWQSKREEVMQQAEVMTANIEAQADVLNQAQTLDDQLVFETCLQLVDRVDSQFGGFGSAPKFPNESQLWLLAMVLQYENEPALKAKLEASVSPALELTLDKMHQGGLFDHLAGGFHRYSVDRQWLVPHFEKMLYNQAQLIRVYSAGYQLTSKVSYLKLLTQTIDYIAREMTAKDGRFYSASDADTHGVEGEFFVWRYDELRKVLTTSEMRLAEKVFCVTQQGNFEGSNILHLSKTLEQTALEFGESLEALTTEIDALVLKMRTIRSQRDTPFVDRKHIAAWNGMLISALVDFELLTGLADYRSLALTAAGCLWRTQYDSRTKTLWRVGMDQEVSVQGNLEDYAYLAEAFLQLYFVTNDKLWLDRADELINVMRVHFWDNESAGFYSSVKKSSGPLITRPKASVDGAIASGNSMALIALLKHVEATGNTENRMLIPRLISVFSHAIQEQPAAHTFMLSVLQKYQRGSRSRIQYAANGGIRIEAVRVGNRYELIVECEGDWHVNHPDANSQGLMSLRVSNVDVAFYPRPQMLTTSFSDEPVPVLPSTFTLPISSTRQLGTSRSSASSGLKLMHVEIRLQACSTSVCIAPETLKLTLPQIQSFE